MAFFLYSLLSVLRNTVTGLDEVNPAIVEAAKGMGMNSRRQLLKVRLPLAWPVVIAGVRVSSLLVIGIAAVAVLVGGDGLGTYIQGSLTRLGLPGSVESVWVGTVFAVLLGLALDVVFATVQRFASRLGCGSEGVAVADRPMVRLNQVTKVCPSSPVPAVEGGDGRRRRRDPRARRAVQVRQEHDAAADQPDDRAVQQQHHLRRSRTSPASTPTAVAASAT